MVPTIPAIRLNANASAVIPSGPYTAVVICQGGACIHRQQRGHSGGHQEKKLDASHKEDDTSFSGIDGGVISPAKLANTLNISEIEGIAHENVLFLICVSEKTSSRQLGE
jgi:hypothetical protein